MNHAERKKLGNQTMDPLRLSIFDRLSFILPPASPTESKIPSCASSWRFPDAGLMDIEPVIKQEGLSSGLQHSACSVAAKGYHHGHRERYTGVYRAVGVALLERALLTRMLCRIEQ